jgi:hypothetical protein
LARSRDERHSSALGGQTPSDRAPDAAAGARDQSRLASQ